MRLACCELCGAEAELTFHHLIPRCCHRNKWFRKNFDRDRMHEGLRLCRGCHHAIHAAVPDEKRLGRYYNTKSALLAHPQIARHVAWSRRRAGA